MATNLNLDDKLIEHAKKVGHHRTKKEAVIAALQEYIEHKQQQEIITAFGSIDFEDTYDYKKTRNRK